MHEKPKSCEHCGVEHLLDETIKKVCRKCRAKFCIYLWSTRAKCPKCEEEAFLHKPTWTSVQA